MFASLLNLLILAAFFAPGLYLAQHKQALTVGFVGRCFLAFSLGFLLLGFLIKMFPWLVDPRIVL